MGFSAPTYNGAFGSDYLDGNGKSRRGPATNSSNINYALGINVTENSKLEFKGLVIHQQNLEFPGLYFRRQDPEHRGLQPAIHCRQASRTSTS